MISCRRATELMSKSLEEPLTLQERASLAIHNYICEFCEQFRKQLEVLRRAMSGISESPDAPPECVRSDAKLTPEQKERIISALERELKASKDSEE